MLTLFGELDLASSPALEEELEKVGCRAGRSRSQRAPVHRLDRSERARQGKPARPEAGVLFGLVSVGDGQVERLLRAHRSQRATARGRHSGGAPERELTCQTRSEIERRLAAGDPSLFGELFELLAVAVMIRDPTGELVYANRAGHAYLGIETLEQLRGRSTADDDVRVLDRGRARRDDQLGDVPSTRARGGEPSRRC